MVENTSYAAPRSRAGLQPDRDTAVPYEPLLWARGALLGLTLAAAVITLSFIVARVTLASPLKAVRVRLDITDVMAEAVTGHFGARERVVAFYTLREVRADYQPTNLADNRAIFDISANIHAFGLFSPLDMAIAPDSAVCLDMRLYAINAFGGDLYLLETNPMWAIASGQAVLVGCITDTLPAAELDTIQHRGGSHQYGRMLPGQCTAGAALPLTASPYRVSYSVDVSRVR